MNAKIECGDDIARLAAAAPDLDAVLTPEECAKWLKVSPNKLSKLRASGLIVSFDFGRSCQRYHVRSLLWRLHHQAGLPDDFIAAMLGEKFRNKTKPH